MKKIAVEKIIVLRISWKRIIRNIWLKGIEVIDFYYNGMKYEKAVWNNPLH